MRLVGIYARTSRAEQDDPTSIPVQLADCRERVADEGWEVVAEYVDAGISGWKRRHRPDYERLVADAESGRIDTVLCREYERLLRNDKEGQRWLDLFDTRGFADFRFTLESDIDLRRARDRKDWKERVAGAVYYSDRLSERVKRTKQARRLAGAYSGGGPTFGYKFVKGTGLVVDPEQAAIIHDAVRQLSRHVSLYRITVDWNAAGRTTANGARWRPATIRRMLRGEHLTGGKGYPAILDDVEAAIVRQELGEQQTLKRGRPAGRKYPLVGFMQCGDCDTKLIGSGGSYRCSVSHGGCGRISIRATPVEQYVLAATFRVGWREVARNMDAPDRRPSTPPVVDTSPLLDELHEVEARLEEVSDALADGTLSVQVAGRTAAKLDERRRALMEELARNLPPAEPADFLALMDVLRMAGAMPAMEELRRRGVLDIPEPDPAFRERWEAHTLTEAEVLQLREVFAVFIDHVDVSHRERRGKSFDPARVEIVWGS